MSGDPGAPAPAAVGEVLLDEQAIRRRVHELGREISATYGSTPIHVVGVLRGALFFLADLVRAIDAPLTYDFVRVTSYAGRAPAGPPRITLDPDGSLSGCDVLLVEDIVDTGATIEVLREAVGRQRPNSLRVCVLLDKPSRRRVPVPIDWVGFTIPDRFVVGYGLDLDERFRNLPYVAALDEQSGPADPAHAKPSAGRSR